MNSALKAIILLSAAILSGILLYASFPPLDFSFLAWISLVPILTALTFARYLQSFLMAFVTGTVLFGIHGWWLNVVPGFPLVAFFAIVFYCAIYFGLFGLCLCIIVRRSRWPKVLVAPILWVSIEYIRSNLSFLALPWVLLGYSQHNTISIIQIASTTSVYGVSFLVVLVNTAVAEGFLWVLNRLRDKEIPRPSPRVVLSSIVGALVTLSIVHLWGEHQVRTLGSNAKEIITASLIQGNIPQNEKWDPRYRGKIMERYHGLTLQASQEIPELIIWPETATPGYLRKDPQIYVWVRDLVRKTGIPLLLGSGSHAKIKRKGRKIYRLVNNAFLMDSKGRIVSTYTKMRLLPFGEYLPLEGRFPWPKWLVPKHGIFIPGAFPTVFEIPEGRFGVVICWEGLFPDLFREFVKKGCDFM